MTDWTRLAKAVLKEVGLTFNDVYELGRPWLRGPKGFSFMIGRPKYRGTCHMPSINNQTSRQRPLIGLTGPVDSEWMLALLAHECGHVAMRHGGSSTPTYVEEAQAEQYGLDALRRHLGREPHPHLVDIGRKYVRGHCWHRFRELGASPTKRWDRGVVEWCGFDPGEPLAYIPQA